MWWRHGVLTLLIIATTANRIILTAIREKHGKESTFYRNSKLISGMLFLIFFVNCLSSIGKWIFGIGMQTKTQASTTFTTNTSFISRPTVLTTILIIIYIALMASAYRRVSISQVLITTTILTAGTHIIHGSTAATVCVGIFSVIVAICFLCDFETMQKPEKRRSKSKLPKKAFSCLLPGPHR